MLVPNKNKKKDRNVIPGSREKINNNTAIVNNTDGQERYKRLIKKIGIQVNQEIESQIEIAKSLYEIKQKKLFIHGNYKTFDDFYTQYKIGRTQAYKYVCIGLGIDKGLLDTKEVLSIGLNQAEKTIKSNPKYMSFTGERNKSKQPNKKKTFTASFKIPDKYRKLFLLNKSKFQKNIVNWLEKNN